MDESMFLAEAQSRAAIAVDEIAEDYVRGEPPPSSDDDPRIASFVDGLFELDATEHGYGVAFFMVEAFRNSIASILEDIRASGQLGEPASSVNYREWTNQVWLEFARLEQAFENSSDVELAHFAEILCNCLEFSLEVGHSAHSLRSRGQSSVGLQAASRVRAVSQWLQCPIGQQERAYVENSGHRGPGAGPSGPHLSA